MEAIEIDGHWITEFRSRQQLRRQLWAQANGICGICGKEVPHPRQWRHVTFDQTPTIDHIVPRGMGGPDTIENMQIAHRACNGRKGMSMGPANTLAQALDEAQRLRDLAADVIERNSVLQQELIRALAEPPRLRAERDFWRNAAMEARRRPPTLWQRIRRLIR